MCIAQRTVVLTPCMPEVGDSVWVRINSFMFQPSAASWSVVVEAISKWGVECCAEFWIFWSPSGVIWWILKFWVVMEDRYIVNMIKQRKSKWFNHVLCHGGPLRDILEGKMNGVEEERDYSCW